MSTYLHTYEFVEEFRRNHAYAAMTQCFSNTKRNTQEIRSCRGNSVEINILRERCDKQFQKILTTNVKVFVIARG